MTEKEKEGIEGDPDRLARLSIQALAQALRPQLQVGDTLKLLILKEGKEPHQGVGYLEDGSMVVVDGGSRYRGQEIEVVVTQAIQTQVGRLFFARPAQGAQ